MDYKIWSKGQLIRHISTMNQELLRLQELMKESDWLEGCLKGRTLVLNERMKELDCVCKAVRISRSFNLTREEKTQKIVDLMPSAWLYSQSACAKAGIGGSEFQTRNYSRTDIRQAAQIRFQDAAPGELEVCYNKSVPEKGAAVFLPEEETLLLVISEILGAIWDSSKK